MSPTSKPLIIVCPNCGTENKISTPLCSDCGARLYQDGEFRKVKEDPKRTARRRAIRTFIITWIVLTVAGVVGLVLWPHAAIDVPIQPDPSSQVERYLTQISARRDSKIPVPRTAISQNNLNSYFGQNNDPEAKKYSGILISETRILLVTNEPNGPFDISTRLILEPEDEEGTSFVPTKFWVGHLPLPISKATSWTQSLAERFGLTLEEEIWGEIKILGVVKSSIVVDVEWAKP